MKVVFFTLRDESCVYEFPDDVSEAELSDAAFEWMNDNVAPYYEILEDNDDEEFA